MTVMDIIDQCYNDVDERIEDAYALFVMLEDPKSYEADLRSKAYELYVSLADTKAKIAELEKWI